MEAMTETAAATKPPVEMTRSGGFIGTVNLGCRGVDRLFAFAQIVIIAYAFGASNGADVFFLASIAPLTIGVVVGEALSRSLLTMLTSPQVSASPRELAAAGALISIAIVAALTGIYLALALPLVIWLHPDGSHAIGPWLAFAPLGIALALSGYLGGILVWSHRYVWAALRYPFSGGAALALLAAAIHFTNGLNTVAAGVSTGYAIALLPLYAAVATRLGFGWIRHASASGFSAAFAGRRRVGAGVGAGLIGGQLIVLLERLLAAPLGAGSVSSLAYARGVAGAPALATEALGAGAYPGFVRAHSVGDTDFLKQSFLVWFRIAVLLGVAFAAFFIAFGHDLVAVLFERGRFGVYEVGRAGGMLVAFALSTLAGGVAALFVTTLYGLDRFSGILYRELGVFCAYLVLAPSLRYAFGAVGLAWAFSVAQSLGAILAGGLVVRYLGLGVRGLIREGLVPLAPHVVAVCAAFVVIRLAVDDLPWANNAREGARVGTAALLLVVLGAVWVMRSTLPEAKRLRALAPRIRRREPRQRSR
jgi:putative peptidoglycan lipid II flippase